MFVCPKLAPICETLVIIWPMIRANERRKRMERTAATSNDLTQRLLQADANRPAARQNEKRFSEAKTVAI